MKVRLKLRDLDKKMIIAFWMFIIYIRQGAEYFIGKIAWYAVPLLYLGGVLTAVFCLKYVPLIRKNRTGTALLYFLCVAIQLFWKNFDLANGKIYNIVCTLSFFGMFLVFSSVNTDKWVPFLLKCMAIVGAFYSFWTIASYLSPALYKRVYNVLQRFSVVNLWAYYSKGYISGLTTHWTANGIYICVGLLPTACAAFFMKGTKREKNLWILLFLSMAISLLLSAKRGHTIFAIASIFATYYFYRSDRPYSRVINIVFAAIASVALFLVVASFIPGVMNVLNRFMEFSVGGDISNGRDNLQSDILTYVRNKPLLGNGWLYFPYENRVWNGQYAHNVYLQLLCDTGIVGFLIYIGFFLNCLFQSVSTLVRVRKKRAGYTVTNTDEWILCSSVCYQIFFLLYCATGNPLYDMNCCFPYYMMCAAALSIIYNIRKSALFLTTE